MKKEIIINNGDDFSKLVFRKDFLKDLKKYQDKKNNYLNNKIGIPINIEGADSIKLEKAFYLFRQFNKYFDIKEKKILEVGSGFGGFVCLCNIKGGNVFGIEPDNNMVELTKKMLKLFDIDSSKIINASGENLPFLDNEFEAVVSFQVLEHVENPEKVIKESCRVLKKGGILYFIIPNYKSFYEGHIKKIWFPFLSKKIAPWYLSFLGLQKNSLDLVNFINPKVLKKIAENQTEMEIVSMGREEFRKIYFNDKKQIKKIKNKKIRFITNILFFLKINKLVREILIKFNWYYPIVFILRKK